MQTNGRKNGSPLIPTILELSSSEFFLCSFALETLKIPSTFRFLQVFVCNNNIFFRGLQARCDNMPLWCDILLSCDRWCTCSSSFQLVRATLSYCKCLWRDSFRVHLPSFNIWNCLPDQATERYKTYVPYQPYPWSILACDWRYLGIPCLQWTREWLFSACLPVQDWGPIQQKLRQYPHHWPPLQFLPYAQCFICTCAYHHFEKQFDVGTSHKKVALKVQ